MTEPKNSNGSQKFLLGLVIAIVALFASLISYNTISIGQVTRDLNLKADKTEVSSLAFAADLKADKSAVAQTVAELKADMVRALDKLQATADRNTALILEMIQNQKGVR